MATINYKCSVCKKEVELLENSIGLNIVGRCSLTDGCSGKLLKLKRNPYNLRESIKYYNDDLLDFDPRNKFYKHIQFNKNNKWKVNHNLNNHPIVVVFVKVNNSNVMQKIDNSTYIVSYTNENSLEISGLSEQYEGIAHCIARTSSPSIAVTATPPTEYYQVTTNGTFTFAIPKLLTKFEPTPTVTPTPTLPLDLFSNGNIQIEIGITRPNEDEVVCFENIPVSQISSPWLSWSEIIIRNRRNYYVKMKNLLNFSTFDDSNLTFDDIPNGTKIRFIRIDYGTGVKQIIPSRGLFLLLSKSPYSLTDKNLKQVIDLGEIIDSKYWYLTYNNGEVYAELSSLETVYPDIRKVA